MKLGHFAAPQVFGDHSTISRVTLSFFRPATAFTIVRIDFAVRPCLPITRPEISLRNPQLEHRGSLALSLLDLHRVRIVYQLLCDELNELLHGVTPLKKSKGSSYKPP